MQELKTLQTDLEQAVNAHLKSATPDENKSSQPDIEWGEKASKLLSYLQDVRERKYYANRIFWVVIGWLFLILAILLLVGFKIMLLSDAVLIALIGSTTANVTIFLVIVAKYLFPSIDKKD